MTDPTPSPRADGRDTPEPCPFCGSVFVMRYGFPAMADHPNAGGSCYECLNCGASGPLVFGDKESLAWTWNRRASLRPAPEPGWRVRPLVWNGPCAGDYAIRLTYGQGPEPLMLVRASHVLNWFEDEDAAKAAAQADHEARVSACLEPAPPPDAPPRDGAELLALFDDAAGPIIFTRQSAVEVAEDIRALLARVAELEREAETARERAEAAQERFAAWFRANYPGPYTIIHKPDWHAPKIFRAALAALRAAPETGRDESHG